MFRALKGRNYQLFFFGQGISLIGTWMQRVALGWLVYKMTNSAFLLGLIAFVGQLPVSILSPFAGALADRFDRRKLLIWTQILETLQAAILTFLTLMGIIQEWHIVLLSCFLGILFAFESPTRQTFIIDMTGPEDLANGIALNSSLFNAARLIGPALAGFIVAKTGEGVVFAANAVSYVAVIFSLYAMRIPEHKKIVDREGVFKRIREGVNYAFGAGPIRFLLLMIALITLAVSVHAVLLPVYARDILRGGPETLGLLMAASGAGALSGAILLAMRKTVKRLAGFIAYSNVLCGVFIIVFAFNSNFYVSMICLYVLGITSMHEVAGTNTLVQSIVPDKMRGRVMSLFILCFLGIMPFGNLIAGCLASIVGTPLTVFFSGVVVIIAGIIFVFHKSSLEKSIGSMGRTFPDKENSNV